MTIVVAGATMTKSTHTLIAAVPVGAFHLSK